MFSKRLKIFVIIITLPLLIYIGRLVQMQFVSRQYYQERIDELKRGRSQQLKTIRGRILDRNGIILAADEPKFRLCINYKLCCFLDTRVTHKIPKEEKNEKIEELKQIIQKCAQFKAVDPNEIEAEITQINNGIWVQRQFQAWRTSFPDSKIERPVKALKGFRRVHIPAGENKTVIIPLKADELKYWNEEEQAFVLEKGKLQLLVGASSEDIRLTGTIEAK